MAAAFFILMGIASMACGAVIVDPMTAGVGVGVPGLGLWGGVAGLNRGLLGWTGRPTLRDLLTTDIVSRDALAGNMLVGGGWSNVAGIRPFGVGAGIKSFGDVLAGDAANRNTLIADMIGADVIGVPGIAGKSAALRSTTGDVLATDIATRNIWTGDMGRMAMTGLSGIVGVGPLAGRVGIKTPVGDILGANMVTRSVLADDIIGAKWGGVGVGSWGGIGGMWARPWTPMAMNRWSVGNMLTRDVADVL